MEAGSLYGGGGGIVGGMGGGGIQFSPARLCLGCCIHSWDLESDFSDTFSLDTITEKGHLSVVLPHHSSVFQTADGIQ